MTAPTDPHGYYRRIGPVLVAHLAGREVHATLDEPSVRAEPLALEPVPSTTQELLALLTRGLGQLLIGTTDRIALHLIPGEGSDIATAASAALQLAEQCLADGLAPVALTDGGDGLWLMARVGGDTAVTAGRYAHLLTDRAPELATADPAQADGRSLLQAYPGPAGTLVPVPYTLLPDTASPDAGHAGAARFDAAGPAAIRAVIPLHLDEIAAMAAGMPAELTADDVPGRLADRGDLAAALLDAPPGGVSPTA